MLCRDCAHGVSAYVVQGLRTNINMKDGIMCHHDYLHQLKWLDCQCQFLVTLGRPTILSTCKLCSQGPLWNSSDPGDIDIDWPWNEDG